MLPFILSLQVDRTAYPWLIVCGHRSIYCRKTEDPECNAESKSLRYGLPIEALEKGVNVADLPSGNSNDIPRVYGLEDLFREYGVNLYIGGHTHHYERSWPVYKEVPNKLDYMEPTATAYITAGMNSSPRREGCKLTSVPLARYRRLGEH